VTRWLLADPQNASARSVFTGWSGACNGTTAICALVVDQNLSVGATFARAFTLSVSSNNKGRVSTDDGAISCGGTNKQGTGSCSARSCRHRS